MARGDQSAQARQTIERLFVAASSTAKILGASLGEAELQRIVERMWGRLTLPEKLNPDSVLAGSILADIQGEVKRALDLSRPVNIHAAPQTQLAANDIAGLAGGRLVNGQWIAEGEEKKARGNYRRELSRASADLPENGRIALSSIPGTPQYQADVLRFGGMPAAQYTDHVMRSITGWFSGEVSKEQRDAFARAVRGLDGTTRKEIDVIAKISDPAERKRRADALRKKNPAAGPALDQIEQIIGSANNAAETLSKGDPAKAQDYKAVIERYLRNPNDAEARKAYEKMKDEAGQSPQMGKVIARLEKDLKRIKKFDSKATRENRQQQVQNTDKREQKLDEQTQNREKRAALTADDWPDAPPPTAAANRTAAAAPAQQPANGQQAQKAEATPKPQQPAKQATAQASAAQAPKPAG